MAYFPKSMIKKILPGSPLALDLSSIIDKLLDLLFGSSSPGANNSSTPGQGTAAGTPGATLSTNDITVFQTRNLEVYAMTNEDFEQGNFDNAVFVSSEVPVETSAEPVIVRFRPRPLLVDYNKGYIDRYVLYDIRNESIIEVSQEDYVEFRTLRYKRSTVISWYIFGNADDYQIGKYIYPGVRNNNIDVLKQAEPLIPGISDYFEDKTEYLLSDIGEYSGDPEVVNEPLPEDPIDEQTEEDLEDLGFGDDTIDIPEPPKVDLDFKDDLAGDMSAADELLGNLSGSIEDLIAEQDEVTAEQEALLAEQEDRLRKLESDQEKQLRKNALNTLIIDISPEAYGKLTNDIINMSSKARRKKKRERLDQGRDEKKIPKIVSGLLHKTKHKDDDGVPYEFTPEEVVEAINESALKQRLLLRISGRSIQARWTRNQKKYYKTQNVYTIPASTSTNANDIPISTLNYQNISLTPKESSAAINVLNGRDRRVANKRALIFKIMKEQKHVLEEKATGSSSSLSLLRNKTYDRYQEYRRRHENTDGTSRYSQRNRGSGRGGANPFDRD